MVIEEYSKVVSAFSLAFGEEVPYPGWQDVKHMPVERVLEAIRRVKANPLTKFNSNPCGVVLDAMLAANKRGRLTRGKSSKGR